MVSRRWMWVATGLAAGLLMGARVAHAGRAEEDRPGNRPEGMEIAPAQAAAAQSKPGPASAGSVAKAPARRAAPSTGYAADAARTSSRLAPDERAARAFLRTAAVAARIETEASRLASSRAQGDGIREYAGDMLKHHETADLELLWLLHGRDMAQPMLETAQRKALSRLAKLDGAKFDRAYVELVSERRQRSDVQQFERAAAGITDPALKAWIQRQLPAMREQQVAARRLAGGRAAETAQQQAQRLRLSRTLASRTIASNTP